MSLSIPSSAAASSGAPTSHRPSYARPSRTASAHSAALMYTIAGMTRVAPVHFAASTAPARSCQLRSMGGTCSSAPVFQSTIQSVEPRAAIGWAGAVMSNGSGSAHSASRVPLNHWPSST